MPENSDSFDFVCFGALNADIMYFVEKLPEEDEESFILDVEVCSGGSAANTASALAMFGNRVAFYGKTGRDDYGKMLVEELKMFGVKPIVSYSSRSGKAIVLVDREGRRAILVDPGANDEVDDYPRVESRILHLTSFVCKESDLPFRAQISAAKAFKNVSLDPGAIYAGRKDVWELIENCNIFLPNAREIEKICGCGYRKGCEIALKKMKGDDKVVVVKLGSKGCYAVRERNGEREIAEVKAFHVKAIDTTGAGDAFNAGFLHAWIRGYGIEECCLTGNFVAGYSVQHRGARSFPEREELKEFMENFRILEK